MVEIPEELINENPHPQKEIQSELIMEDKLYTILNIKNILSDERFYIEEGV